jgi:general secretion pathway protein B
MPPQKAPETVKPPAKVSVPPQAATAITTVPAPADIIVTGIAWQDERAARRAVINGFLLQEGKVVSGATILEIHQDRVKFKSTAGIFDVRMDAAALPGTSSK